MGKTEFDSLNKKIFTDRGYKIVFRKGSKTSEGFLVSDDRIKRRNFIKEAFCLKEEEKFDKKYEEASTGSGKPYKDYDALKSSALCALLSFYRISDLKIGEVFYDKAYFEVLIKEWDEEFFGKLGLVEAGGASFKLANILREANVEKSKLQLREADNEVNETTGTYSVQYFASLSQSEGEELVKKIITNIFNCGAKYDSDGTSYENPLAEPLCYIDSDGNLSYSFTATPGAGDP